MRCCVTVCVCALSVCPFKAGCYYRITNTFRLQSAFHSIRVPVSHAFNWFSTDDMHAQHGSAHVYALCSIRMPSAHVFIVVFGIGTRSMHYIIDSTHRFPFIVHLMVMWFCFSFFFSSFLLPLLQTFYRIRSMHHIKSSILSIAHIHSCTMMTKKRRKKHTWPRHNFSDWSFIDLAVLWFYFTAINP